MYEQAKKPEENKSRAVANSVVQKKIGAKQEFQFVDNRSDTMTQRKMQEAIHNGVQDPLNGNTIQLMPATAVGTTHLVKINHNSLMEGTEANYVENGEELDVDENSRIISRRGPNQELVGNYDKSGEHMYRWYKIDELQGHNIAGQNKYIREGTIGFKISE